PAASTATGTLTAVSRNSVIASVVNAAAVAPSSQTLLVASVFQFPPAGAFQTRSVPPPSAVNAKLSIARPASVPASFMSLKQMNSDWPGAQEMLPTVNVLETLFALPSNLPEGPATTELNVPPPAVCCA